MRISTRFGIGVALAVLPLLGVVVFSIDRMHELARSNERLTLRVLVDARIGPGVVSRLERLAEYRYKYSVSQDPGYAQKIDEVVAIVDDELVQLDGVELSDEERSALVELRTAWTEFVTRVLPAEGVPAELISSELEHLAELATEIQRLARERMALDAAAAHQLREQTWTTALWVAASAIALSLTLIVLAVHSLRARLDQFIAGTRAVSKGKFSVQLDTRANDELGQVARAFNRMVKSLEQLDRIKADFISSVSHELRTPLVAMLETNRFLLDEVPGPLTDKQRKMLQLNTNAAQRLSSMISSLLDLHRLKAGIRYELEEHDVTELTNVAVHEFEAWAGERSIRLRVAPGEDGVRLLCDRVRYIQVVQNLVENGLKYTPGGGVVEVSLRRAVRATLPAGLEPRIDAREYAVLAVIDSGPGIPPHDRRRVFEKFFRRQGRSSDGGMGLGLAICQEIVEAHGGAIAVGDCRLGGAGVYVALPVEGVPA